MRAFFVCPAKKSTMVDRTRNVWLSRKQKNRVRSIGREALERSGGDEDWAIEIAEARIRQEFGSIFVTIAITLVIELIKYWFSKRQSNPEFEPQSVFVAGEPGVSDDDDYRDVDSSPDIPAVGDWT